MKSILLIFGFLTVTATTINVTAKKEDKADEAKEAIVTSTVSKFAEIKQEVNTLKTELNEVKATLDSVSNDTAVSFKLLPISHYKKN